jgi:hypothetical protein
MGRWLSPDWSAKEEPVPYSKLDDPQTLNLCSYVTNNPLTRVDEDGHDESLKLPLPAPTFQKDQTINSDATKTSNRDGVEPVQHIEPQIKYSVTAGTIDKVTDSGITALGTGYSGKGDGVDNPSMENVSGAPGKPVAGPIPEGKYTIGKEQANKLGNGKVLSNSMRLTPSAGNNMYGRGGFLMHGGSWNLTSSEGCIVVPDVGVRDAVGSSGINVLTVTQ